MYWLSQRRKATDTVESSQARGYSPTRSIFPVKLDHGFFQSECVTIGNLVISNEDAVNDNRGETTAR